MGHWNTGETRKHGFVEAPQFKGNAEAVRAYLQLEEYDKALAAFHARPDTVGATVIIRAATNGRMSLETAVEVLEAAVDAQVVDMKLLNGFATGCKKCSRPDMAIRLWHVLSTHNYTKRLRLSSQVYTTILRSVLKTKERKLVVPICRRIVTEKVPFDNLLCTTVLEALRLGGVEHHTKYFLEQLESSTKQDFGARPDRVTFGAVFKCCTALKDRGLAGEMYKKFRQYGHIVDGKMLSTLIDMFVACGDVERALHLFQRLSAMWPRVNTIHIERFLIACLDNGQAAEAMAIHKRYVKPYMLAVRELRLAVVKTIATQGSWEDTAELLSTPIDRKGGCVEEDVATALNALPLLPAEAICRFVALLGTAERAWPPFLAEAVARHAVALLPATSWDHDNAPHNLGSLDIPCQPSVTFALVKELTASGNHEAALRLHTQQPADPDRLPHALRAALHAQDPRAEALLEEIIALGRETEEQVLGVVDYLVTAGCLHAASDLARQQQLLAQGFVARARVDDAITTLAQARARVAELEAAVQVGQLPARDDDREAARALAEAALNSRAQTAWRVEQKRQSAPMTARVQDVFMHPGEWVAAGQPVLALLPPTHRKARFYVPQSVVGKLALDAPVNLHCDGCGAAIPARISFIANGPEYTPPVIYSNQQRDKLVFLVEARPVKPEDAERLHPGQPLDVTP